MENGNVVFFAGGSRGDKPHGSLARVVLSEVHFPSMKRLLTVASLMIYALAHYAGAAEPPIPRRLTHDGHFKQRPMWSPDGKQVVFTRHRGGKIELVVMAADGSYEKTITTGKLPQYDACWSPDGSRLAFTHVPQSGTQGNLDVYLSKADGSEPAQFAGDRGKLSHEEYPAWSPDGKRIAFSSTFEGNQELYVAEIGGPDRRRLTNDPALDAHPAWSPDGRKIAFATGRWGDFEIAVMDADGGNVTRLTESRGLDDYPVFSPDGKRLAFMSNRDGNFEIYVMNADGTGPENVTQHAALDNFPAWTPDGKLAFVSNRAGGFDIYVVDAP
jgi:TolB protein